MNTLIQVSKLHIIHSHNITTFHLLKNGFPFLYMTVLNVNAINITPKDWAFQVHMYAYAHNSQPLSELNNSPHEIDFHTRPRIPLTFDINLNRDTSKTCISR